MKVIDKINQKVAAGQHFFSFEFFPPKTEEGVDALWERMERMVAHGPIFCDITWGAGGSTANATLDIAAKMQNMVRGSLLVRHLLVLHKCKQCQPPNPPIPLVHSIGEH
eukprot:605370-Pelagomonas_calceolata.AAC.2